MSYIKAMIGGKSIGSADKVSIDPALGCKNACVGCYAKKSSQRGKNYDRTEEKVFDKDILNRSIRGVQKKGINIARVGKHCDPGDSINLLHSIINSCTDNNFRCVIVSKSLKFGKKTASLLNKGNHVLHMSIGPRTKVIKDSTIISTAYKYSDIIKNIAIRWTEDITQPMRGFVGDWINTMPYIITPMRFPSMDTLNIYDTDYNNFEFTGGYYRPLSMHEDWVSFSDNVCGEVNGEVRCCNCLV